MAEGDDGTTGAISADGVDRGTAARAGCGWRVATMRPQSGGVWRLHRRLFARKDMAQKWANQRTFGGLGNVTPALLEQRDGVVQVPPWMTVRDEVTSHDE